MEEIERSRTSERSVLSDITNNALKLLLAAGGITLVGLSALDIYADGKYDALGLIGDRHPFQPDTPEEEKWVEEILGIKEE